MGSPPTIISSALGTPTRRGKRCVPPAPGRNPELDLRQTALGVGRGHAVVAAKGHFEPAAQRRPVKGGDDRLLARLVARDDLEQRRLHRRLAELGDVGARDEGAALASEHERLDLGSRLRLRQRVEHPAAQRLAERVDRRVVDPNDSDAAAAFEVDDIAHGRAGSPWRIGGRELASTPPGRQPSHPISCPCGAKPAQRMRALYPTHA